ncbi:SDR family oxidoreductase [Agromyces sp. Soil535]|uniref:SDR family oxidoreductase n=1 Tax=Agromyces sp. Soil535 TaxID=1736390 RepID=UPI001F1C1CAF|nr:NAD(P)H-binding protein [Agromyces sp. Soil535]
MARRPVGAGEVGRHAHRGHRRHRAHRTRLVARLTADGHDVVSASRATGVNSYTGEGLAEALAGAEILIDVTNSGYLDERGANDFFYGSTLNLLTHGAAAGVRHHVALSVVGTDRLAQTEGGYFAAKEAQEHLIRRSGRPFTIVHATQFFEFISRIAMPRPDSTSSASRMPSSSRYLPTTSVRRPPR